MAETYRKVSRYREPVEDRNAVVEEENLAVADANPGVTRAQMIVRFVLGVLLSLLALRFILALFGANQANGFVNLVYDVTSPLVAPFRGLFNLEASSGVARFETETLVAAFVYMLIGIGIIRLLDIFRQRSV